MISVRAASWTCRLILLEKGPQCSGNSMSKFAGIHIGLMKLSHIDFRLTTHIVQLNLFQVCTRCNHCLVIFSIELLFRKKHFFPVNIDARIAHVSFFSPE